MRRFLATLLLLGCFTPLTWAQAPMGPRTVGALPALPLADQFQRPFDPAVYRGHVLVLIYGDRASSDANKSLGEWLHVAFHPTAKGLPPAEARKQPVRPLANIPPGIVSPDVHAVAVACCGKVPNLIQGVIRGQIKSGAPDVPVLLDFQDVMKTTFGVVEKVPNLVIVDRAGQVRFTGNGPFTPEQTQQLANIVETLRAEGIEAGR